MENGKLQAYLELADDAFLKRNTKDLYKYAKAIIDIDNKQPLAWFYSGTAIGWDNVIPNVKETMDLVSKSWSCAIKSCTTYAMMARIGELINLELQRLFSGVLTSIMTCSIREPGDDNRKLYNPMVIDLINSVATIPRDMVLAEIATGIKAASDEESFEIEMPKLPYETWKKEYDNFTREFNAVIRVGSVSQFFNTQLYNYNSTHILIDFIIGTCLSAADQLKAYNDVVSVFSSAKADLNRRFGSTFDTYFDNILPDAKKSIELM